MNSLGFDNNRLLSVQALDLRKDDWHTFYLIDALRYTGRRDFGGLNGEVGSFIDLAGKQSFSAPGGFGTYLNTELRKLQRGEDRALFGDPYHWLVRKTDGKLDSSGNPTTSNEELAMPCIYWGDVDYPFRSSEFDVRHAEQAAALLIERVGVETMRDIAAGYALADELSNDSSKESNMFSQGHLDVVKNLFLSSTGSAKDFAGTSIEKTPWSDGRMHGFGSELGLYFLGHEATSSALREAFLLRTIVAPPPSATAARVAPPPPPDSSARDALIELDRERAIAKRAWAAKEKFFNVAIQFYPSAQRFVDKNHLPWLNDSFIVDLHERDILQYSALFLDSNARLPSYFIPGARADETRKNQVFADIFNAASPENRSRYVLLLALGGLDNGQTFTNANYIAADLALTAKVFILSVANNRTYQGVALA